MNDAMKGNIPQGNIALSKKENMAALEAAKVALQEAEQALTHDTTQRLSISHATLVNAITSAAISSKFSLQLELATGLAVYSTFGGVNKEARDELFSVYIESGYDASTSSSPEYKTVHRRLTTTAKLFDYLGADKVAEWGEASSEMLLINTFIRHLEPLNLKSINATLAYVGKPVVPKIEQHTVQQKGDFPQQHTVSDKGMPKGQITPQMTDQQSYEAWLKRRGGTPLEKEWEVKAGFVHVSVEGLDVAIPPETSKEAIIALAMALLKTAQEMDEPEKEAQEANTHEFEPGDDIGNIHPSNPKREVAGNIAVKETVQVDADGNVPAKPKASRYRAAPKK